VRLREEHSRSHGSRSGIAVDGCRARGPEESTGPGEKPVNHPPAVKIVSPKANDAYEENSRVRYEINVSDREDGESKDKGMLVLIASYTDHGLKDDPGQRMQGRDAIRIRIK
jgi:hypothetical protein